MRTKAELDLVDGLVLVGLNDCQIARQTGIPRGTGHISQMPRTWRIRVALDSAYPSIVDECASALEIVLDRTATLVPTNYRMVVVAAYSNAIPALFPQHGPGMKHTRPIVLEPWQREITNRYPEDLIRGLIHSDGSRALNTVHVREKSYCYPRYFFCNHSDDIRQIFCDHLDLLEIPWRRMNRFNISVARREGVARLDEFVGPKA